MTYAERYAATEARRAPLETEHEAALRRALRAQGEHVADLLDAEDLPVSAFMDRTVVHDALRALWTDAVTTFGPAVTEELAPLTKDAGGLKTDATKADAEAKATKDDPWLQIALAFIETTGAEMIREIDATTLSLVRAVVTQGAAEGWGTGRMATEIRRQWPEVARYRAERIARTEIIRASSYASTEAARRTAEEYGLELEKIWLATNDGRTRDSHAAVSGQRRGLDEAFDVNGYAAQYPADASLPASESVQCRCTVVFEPAQPKTYREQLAARNAYIVERYGVLMPRHGREVALQLIAEDEAVNLSPHTVRKIYYAETGGDGGEDKAVARSTRPRSLSAIKREMV